MASSDIIIIGGGVIGLTIAWRLARKGAGVTLLERGEPAREASWAAAGMLAPLAEVHAPGPFLDLAVRSLRLYPKFLEELAEDAGETPEQAGPGMLRIARSEREAQALQASARLARELGFESEWLDDDALRRIEPELSNEIVGAVRSPSEKHVDPRKLCAAILKAVTNRGVKIRSHSAVIDLHCPANQVRGVQLETELLEADCVVLAAGSWSGALASKAGINIPVTPRKGQIITIESSGPPALKHTIYTHSTYLVPRDGRIIVGATEEEAGFDKTLTQEAKTRLYESAVSLAPSLSRARITDSWAGLRPATADGLPLLGFATERSGVYIATGHLRNGILLTPVTGEIAAREILDAHDSPELEAFRPARFASKVLEPTPL